MADDVKDLLIRVSATTELLRSNLTAAERAVADFERNTNAKLGRVDQRFDTLGSGISKLSGMFSAAAISAAGFVTALSIGGIAQAGRAVLNFADDLGTAADQAGIGVERYQTLKEALRTLEIPAEKADKVFKTLQDSLGKVQSGAEDGATKALDRLGVSAKILSGEITSSDQLLDALAASAKGAGSEAQFAADLVDIFGKKIGVDLAAALRDGGVALHQLEADFRSTGNVINQETVERLADANEAVDRFFTNFRQNVTIWAGEAILAAGRVRDAITGTINLNDGRGDIGRQVTTIAKGIQDAQREIADLEARAASTRGIGRAGIAGRQASLRAAIADGERQIQQLIEKGRREVSSFDLGRQSFNPRGANAGTAGRGSRARAVDDDAKLAIKSVGQLAAELGKLDIQNPGDAASARVADFYQAAGIDTEALRKRQDEIDKIRDDAFKQEMANQEAYYARRDDLERDLAYLFESGMRGGTKAIWRDFKNLGYTVIAELLAKWAVGSQSQGVSGGGLGSILASTIGSIFGGGFASGGRPPLGKISMVGERGPELFVPDTAGTIIPNHAIGGNVIQIDARNSLITEKVYGDMMAIADQRITRAAPSIVQASAGATARNMTRRRLNA